MRILCDQQRRKVSHHQLVYYISEPEFVNFAVEMKSYWWYCNANCLMIVIIKNKLLKLRFFSSENNTIIEF
jgi:hypothetical protein